MDTTGTKDLSFVARCPLLSVSRGPCLSPDHGQLQWSETEGNKIDYANGITAFKQESEIYI